MIPFERVEYAPSADFSARRAGLSEVDLKNIADKVRYFNQTMLPIRSEVPSMKAAAFAYPLHGRLTKLSVVFNLTPVADAIPGCTDRIVICAMYVGSVPTSFSNVAVLSAVAERVAVLNTLVMERG